MKNTLVWGALFGVLCSQVQADTNQTAAPEANKIQTTPSTQTPSTPTSSEQPAAATPEPPAAAQTINCDYKIDASTKVVDPSVVISWAEKATTQAFDFEPGTLDTQMQTLQSCFTEQGWNGFNTALEKSGNLNAIKSQQLKVSSQIEGQAQLDETNENQWKLTLPLQVVYQNDKEKVTQLLTIKLTVGRKISGDLGITQMIATPREGAGTTAGSGSPDGADSAQPLPSSEAKPAVNPPSTETTPPKS
jgi:hypothetical protein